jgi:tetratricopeptide (TPR) repeat protein
VRKLRPLAAFTIALPCLAAEWVHIRTPQIEILTDAGEKAGKAMLSRLEQLRGVFVTPDPRPLPLRIFLFNSEKEFRDYTSNSTTSGFYQSGIERDFIVVYAGAGLTRAVAHEYVHLILDRGTGSLPLWFEEGTAELYSNLGFQPGRVVAGDPIPEHLALLSAEKWLPADQFTGTTKTSPLYNERTLTGVFYSECWALVHMLNLAPGWRERMPVFAELLASGRDGDDAFRQAFGKTVDQALVELRGYLNRLRGVALDRPGRGREETIMLESLTQLEATLARADLALHVRHVELAHRLFEAAKKAGPDSPDAEAGLGALALAEDRRDQAREHLDRAIAMGSRDATTYFQLAMLNREAGAGANDLLKRAIDLNPEFGEARFLLGVQASDEGDYAAAADQLRAAADVLPSRSYVWHALAFAQLKLGQTGEARVSASRALRTAGTVTEEQMAEALLNSLQ